MSRAEYLVPTPLNKGAAALFARGQRGGQRSKMVCSSEAAHFDAGGVIVRLRNCRQFMLSGKKHRRGGPAIEYFDGSTVWCEYGQAHRTDGPAIERADGSREWWLRGQPYTDQTSWQAALSSDVA